jgi:aminomethyltransferase
MTKSDMGRRTPFYDRHLRHKARIVNFFGYAMPLQYKSIIAEHLRVRSTVGLFDLSHMGEIIVKGPDALGFVQMMTVNDASVLDVGQVQYTAMCTPQGGIIDDLLVYRLEDAYLLVVNAANIGKDYDWLREHRKGLVEIENRSDEYALLAIQGPRAQMVMARLTDADLDSLGYYHFVQGQAADVPMIISRTGYTGEDGFELYLAPGQAPRVWDAVLESGREDELEPVGLGARDSLRLEMKFALYGQDIDGTTTPLEAGLGWITKLSKGDFIGRPALVEQKERGLSRRLVGFEMKEKAVPRSGYQLQVEGEVVGQVTSGIFSPSLSKGIGMGYLPIRYASTGSRLEVLIRGQAVPADVVKTPFYTKGTHR